MNGQSVRSAPRPVVPASDDRGLGPVLRRAASREAAAWLAIYRFVFRRPRVPAGALAFGYDKATRGMFAPFILLCIIEVPIVDLIVHPWPLIRIPLLAVGIWGAVFMIGMLCGYVTRPHSVGPEGIRVRNGGEADIALPWDLIASVARRRRSVQSPKAFTLEGEGDDQILNSVAQDHTHIDIELEQPAYLRLPAGEVRVREVRIAVDDPQAFLDAVRRFIP